MKILSIASKFPIFTTFVILSLILMYNIKKNTRLGRKKTEEFWERERRANSTRRMPLDTVEYIKIPIEDFPLETEKDDYIIADCIKQIMELKDEPIANFTGLTNTDLKLQYGAPNINHLSKCDNDFTILARNLNDWASRLHELGHDDDAIILLEFAIKNRSDISSGYYLAASIYMDQEKLNKIAWLKRTADTLNSAMASSIRRTLDERYPTISAY